VSERLYEKYAGLFLLLMISCSAALAQDKTIGELRLVVSQGMRMILMGIVLGMVGAFALTRALASLLLGVGTTDAVTFIGVAVLLVAVALLACYIPARRAARVDPLVVLRHE
jgi:putative ABC transport system permease protein